MAKTYAVMNQKGGVGKTTTALMLGIGLSRRGHRVLFVDCDPQANLTYSMGVDMVPVTTMSVLRGTNTAKEAVLETKSGSLIPASINLTAAESEFTETGREYLLKEALEPMQSFFDYIIIDTPPSLGILSLNALTAADEVIIPTAADIFALQGIGRIFQTIATIRKYTNPKINVTGALICRFNKRSNVSKELHQLTEKTAQALNTGVFGAFIRECSAIREAQALRTNPYDHAPRSTAVEDYENFIDELLAKEKK